MNLDFWLYKIYVQLSGDVFAQSGKNADFWAAKIYYSIALGNNNAVPMGRSAEFYLGKFYFYLTGNPASMPYERNIDDWLRVIYLRMRYGTSQPLPTFGNDRSAEYWAQLLFQLIESGNYSLRNPRVNNAVFSVAENATIGTIVGTITGSDPDPGNDLTFTIVSGNTGNAFALNANTGVLTVASALNFEVTPSYSLVIRATDNGGLTGTGTITVNVTDVFEPSDIAGLLAWLEASSGTFQDIGGTIPALAGNTVARWNDRSGNGNNFTQGTATARPTVATVSSKTVINFATNDLLVRSTITGQNQPVTIYIMGKQGVATANEYILDGFDNTNRYALYVFSTTVLQMFAGTGLNSSAVYNNNEHILTANYNGASSLLFQDNVQVASGSAGAQNAPGLTLGARNGGSNFWNGYIKALLVYSGSHNVTQRTQVYNYLTGL